MLDLMQLAQFDRNFRRAFSSDAVWAKFDVYAVQQAVPKPIYQHGKYNLKLDGGFISSTDLYSQINALSALPHLVNVPRFDAKRRRRPICFDNVELIELHVWKLWATHLIEPAPLHLYFPNLIAAKILENLQVCLSLIPKVQLPKFVVAALDRVELSAAKHNSNGNIGRICWQMMGEIDVSVRAVALDATMLELATLQVRADREIVLAAVLRAGRALEGASARLRNDCEIVRVAVQSDDSSLEYASDELRSDCEFLLALLDEIPDVRTYIDDHDWVLCRASAELQNDRKFVLAAVNKREDARRYASDEVRNGPEIVLAFVKTAAAWEEEEYPDLLT